MSLNTIDLTKNFEKSYRIWIYHINGFKRCIRNGKDRVLICDILDLVNHAFSEVSRSYEELEKATTPDVDTFVRYETSLSFTKTAYDKFLCILDNGKAESVPWPQKFSEGKKQGTDTLPTVGVSQEKLRRQEGEKEELTYKTVVEEDEDTSKGAAPSSGGTIVEVCKEEGKELRDPLEVERSDVAQIRPQNTTIEAEDKEFLSVPTSSILVPPVTIVPPIQHTNSPQSEYAAPLSEDTSVKLYDEESEEPVVEISDVAQIAPQDTTIKVENKEFLSIPAPQALMHPHVTSPLTQHIHSPQPAELSSKMTGVKNKRTKLSTLADYSALMVGGKLNTHSPHVKLPAIPPKVPLLEMNTCRKYRKVFQDPRSKRRKGRIKVRLRKIEISPGEIWWECYCSSNDLYFLDKRVT